jgi:hypothetical protein
MKKILAGLITFVLCVSCAASDIEPLKKAAMEGESIETLFNNMAGPNGSVSWYKPAEQPPNNTFKTIGAIVKNGTKQIDMVLLVNTSDMTAVMQTISSNGKIIRYDQFGIPDDMDAFIEIITDWAGLGAL